MTTGFSLQHDAVNGAMVSPCRDLVSTQSPLHPALAPTRVRRRALACWSRWTQRRRMERLLRATSLCRCGAPPAVPLASPAVLEVWASNTHCGTKTCRR